MLKLSDTDFNWVLKIFSFHFFFFLICFSIWKKIKESDKKLNKRIYCSLSKQWLIHQQLLNYCIGPSKIYKKFDFKGKSSHLEKRLFNSASGLFMQKYIIIWIVCIFFIVKTVPLIKWPIFCTKCLTLPLSDSDINQILTLPYSDIIWLWH